MTDKILHTDRINLFIARALAHGYESEEMREDIIRECTNKYIDKLLENEREKTKKTN